MEWVKQSRLLWVPWVMDRLEWEPRWRRTQHLACSLVPAAAIHSLTFEALSPMHPLLVRTSLLPLDSIPMTFCWYCITLSSLLDQSSWKIGKWWKRRRNTPRCVMTTIAETYITFYSLQNTVSQNGVPGGLVLDSQGKAKMQIPCSPPIPDESESQWRGGRDGWNSGI